MPLHPDLTGADLHENKGVSTAADNTVAVATSGATVWKKLTAASLDASAIKNINLVTLSGTVPDMSTNGSVVFVPVPQACSLVSLTASTQATTTGSSASLSVYNGATLLGTFTVTIGSPGITTGASITGAFAAGSSIKIISAGGSTGACPLNLTLTISLT